MNTKVLWIATDLMPKYFPKDWVNIETHSRCKRSNFAWVYFHDRCTFRSVSAHLLISDTRAVIFCDNYGFFRLENQEIASHLSLQCLWQWNPVMFRTNWFPVILGRAIRSRKNTSQIKVIVQNGGIQTLDNILWNIFYRKGLIFGQKIVK